MFSRQKFLTSADIVISGMLFFSQSWAFFYLQLLIFYHYVTYFILKEKWIFMKDTKKQCS